MKKVKQAGNAESDDWNTPRFFMDADGDLVRKYLDARNEDGRTPLHMAAAKGHSEAIAALIDAGADPDARNEDGRTPLHMAAEKGHSEAIAALIDAGADPDARNEDGRTPLYMAAEKGHSEAIAALIDAGADPDARNENDRTPLYVAAGEGHSEAIAALIDAGADPDARNEHGNTPLDMAVFSGQTTAIAALIDAGADPDARNENGNTPLDMAAQGQAARLFVKHSEQSRRDKPERDSLPDSFTLIIGPARSGTTLIGNCFMSHSTVSGILEPYQQRRREPYEVTDMNTLLNDYGIDYKKKPNFAIKETTTRIKNVRFALQAAANAQDQGICTGLIIVLRCPLETYLSQVEAVRFFWKIKKNIEVSKKTIVSYLLDHRAILRELCHQARRFHYRFVSYDFFCEYPETELARLMALIPTSLEMHQLNAKQSKSTAGFGDPKFLSRKGISKNETRKEAVALVRQQFSELPAIQYATQLHDLIQVGSYQITDHEKLDALTVLTNSSALEFLKTPFKT